MDILNILNDFIKNNKTPVQLADEFVKLINNGTPIYKIMRQYDFSQEKIKDTMINAGYQVNINNQKWEKANNISPKSEITDETVSEMVNNNINKKDLINVIDNMYKEDVISVDKKLKISPEVIVDLLNDGVDIDAICKQYNITSPDSHNLLLKNGYQHYLFMDYWTKMNKRELCIYLVEQLNEGFTIYDLSGKYVKNKIERLNFVSKLEQLLKLYEYNYNPTNKTWSKMNFDNKITQIVDQINKDIPMKLVAETFNTTSANLRITLKNNQYRYDSLFKIWTKLDRQKLLEILAIELDDNEITFNELEARGINIDLVKSELKQISSYKESSDKLISNNSIILNQKASADNISQNSNNINDEHITERSQIETNDHSQAKEKEIYSQQQDSSFIDKFSDDEIANLKEMINYWKQQNIERSNHDNKLELSVFMESELLSKLTKASEIEGLSRSLIIEKALKSYLKI